MSYETLDTLGRRMVQKLREAAGASWDPLESTCRHASLSIL